MLVGVAIIFTFLAYSIYKNFVFKYFNSFALMHCRDDDQLRANTL